MSEIISIILSKPEWQTKINDSTIVNKWIEELQQQGISDTVLNCIIELLKKSTITSDYQIEDEYQWHLELGVEAGDIGLAAIIVNV